QTAGDIAQDPAGTRCRFLLTGSTGHPEHGAFHAPYNRKGRFVCYDWPLLFTQRSTSMHLRLSAVATLVVVFMSFSQPGERVPLKKGERVVFLGDSITEGGLGAKGYVTLIKNHMKEKHADLDITIIGAGVSGNRVPHLQQRLEKDVLAKKPTIVVIYIGINDVWHGEKDPKKGTSKEDFEKGLKDIIGKIKDAGARVVLCTPSVIGEKTGGANNLDTRLDEYASISRKVAGD